jgi:Tol biopolymer transport system component
MTPEQYRRVGELYHAAMELAPEVRADFLSGACGGDEELRREIESLLRAHERADGFIAGKVAGVAADLAAQRQNPSLAPSLIGHSISHYQIISLLGAGGMGKVYLAEDTRLGRKVAVKLLPAEFARDAERVRRFGQEARAASALNHPNIITIHEIGETSAAEGGAPYIVSEFVAGQTLRALLRGGRLDIGQAAAIAEQVAGALSVAHEAGIIHRDIKPENVMVRPDGLVKVLDFGLAKLTETPAQAVDSQGLAMTKMSTDAGVVMGTVSYMSPEQARGLKVDHRTDVFSLGVMLYEMVAGRRPFEGETASDVIAAILQNDPPPLTAPGADAPRELERIVSKTLRKEREERYQTVEDLLFDLKNFQQGSHSSAASVAVDRGAKRLRSWVVPTLISLAVLLAVAGGLFWWRFQSEAPPPIGRPLLLTTYPGFELNPALSPDGRQIAFTWNGDKQDNFDIYIRLVGSNSQLQLTKHPGEDLSPAWSPDGNTIAFLRRLDGDRNELLLIPALGGPERKLTETFIVDDSKSRLSALAWSPDGRWLAVSHREAEDLAQDLFLVSAETGEKRRLTRSPINSSRDFTPTFSPDGRAVLFTRFSSLGTTAEMYVLSLSQVLAPAGEPRHLKTAERFVRSPVWTPDGRYIVFLAAPNIGEREQTELRKIAASGADTSERVSLLEGEINEMSLGRHLVYPRRSTETDIYRAEIPAPGRPASQPQLLISSTRLDNQPRYSPDGKKIAFGSTRSGAAEIWLADADGSNQVQLTSFGGPMIGARDWSPDGQRLVFHARPEGQADIFTIPAAGGAPKRLTTDPKDDVAPSYSRDGRSIYFVSYRSGRDEIWKMPAEGGEAVQITSAGGHMPYESHDDRTLYFRHPNGEKGIWKMPVEGGEAVQITGPITQWAFAVGTEGLFYSPAPDASQKGSIHFVSFATGQSRTVVVADRPIGGIGLGLSPDQRFLAFAQSARIDFDLMLIENFVVR